jgi:acyl-coenzyme A synthetase/AMP-(fatty) acid ligase
MDEYPALENRIASLIESGAIDEAAFRDAALAVYRFQRRHNAPLANYCEHRGVPRDIANWREIPAVPQSVFKRFRLSVAPPEAVTKTFLTSGTTGESRGQHHFLNTRLYDTAIVCGWERLALPKLRTLILTPSPAEAPQSSLSHMFGVLAERSPSRFCVTAEGRLDVTAITSELARNEPVAMLGTALAFLNLFEQLGSRTLSAAPGSFAMETGGYKGSGRDIPKAELYTMFGKYLGMEADQILNEYGMTELSSQCYTRGLNRAHEAPPWLRTLVIDPETGKEVAIGEKGILQLFDLANLGSSLAIETQDLAVREEHGFTLLGRDPAALPRGCSRATDEALRT